MLWNAVSILVLFTITRFYVGYLMSFTSPRILAYLQCACDFVLEWFSPYTHSSFALSRWIASLYNESRHIFVKDGVIIIS